MVLEYLLKGITDGTVTIVEKTNAINKIVECVNPKDVKLKKNYVVTEFRRDEIDGTVDYYIYVRCN